VVGEHGPSQFVAWSTVTVAGVPIDRAVPSETFDHDQVANETMHEAQQTIEAKGAISFGIGAIVASVCDSILSDKRDVCPISHFQEDLGCYLSMPVILGRSGLLRTIQPVLSFKEKDRLAASATSLKQSLRQLEDAI
jgi:L-lactate dehydrogenase